MNKSKRLTFALLINALNNIGIKKGDIVLIQSKIDAVGPIDSISTRADILNFYYSAFKEVIGNKGTILVFTGYPDYARYGKPFYLESSPSRFGVFSEFIRKMSGTIRSLHPIVNVSGNGLVANEICNNPHFEGFG